MSVSCISCCLNAQRDYEQLMDCAANPELRFLVSTTEAGIVYDPACQFTDTWPAHFPGKLTQFLLPQVSEIPNAKGKGFLIFSCELIDNNGKNWRTASCAMPTSGSSALHLRTGSERKIMFCSTLVDRIVTGIPTRGSGRNLPAAWL